MKSKKLLALCCAIVFVSASVFSTNVSAQAAEENNETDKKEETFTYYFLTIHNLRKNRDFKKIILWL